MMRVGTVLTAAFVYIILGSNVAYAQPYAGWYADLNTYFHDVSGTVTVVDDDTIRVDNFIYDGSGIVVYFWLAESTAPGDLVNGLAVGPELTGPPFDGSTPLIIDLPGGQTIDGYGAVSVWCVDAQVDFGSGQFVVPEPTSLAILAVGALTALRRRR